MRTNICSLSNINHILIIRSAPLSIFNKCVETLKKRFPHCCITGVAQPSVKKVVEEDTGIKDTIVYHEKEFSIFKSLKYLPLLRKKKYDLTVILFTLSSSITPSNVIWFTLLIKTRYRAMYDMDGEWEIFPWYFFIKNLLAPFQILGKATILLFISIFKILKPSSSKKTLIKRRIKSCIGIDTRSLSYGTGVQRYIFNLIQNILSIDNEFSYIFFQESSKDFFNSSNLKKRLLALPLFHREEHLSLPIQLFSNRVDLFHGCNFIAPFIRHCKGVVTIHDVGFLHAESHSRQYDKRAKRWIPFSIKHADIIITPSVCTKDDILRFLHIPQDRIKVVHEGVEHKRYRVIEDKEAISPVRRKYALFFPYILCVSSAGVRKNHVGLIRAYHMLREQYKIHEYKLFFTGKREFFPNEVFSVLENLNLKEGKDVLWTGFVEEDELPLLYNAASLFVYPSFFEGFGLPVLEAMACGTPVITSNTSSLPEVAGDAAILIDPYNVEELSYAMYKVLTDNSLKEQMREKGLGQAAKFSWEKCARETLEVYKEVLGI